ncbi:MAG TPA: hypothetical protein VKR57_12660 [Terriglobales bacterium]|nr:hypothetical protein [Terriglobales bacterium]
MHRLTARLLLTLVLVGTLAPVTLAISAPAPHACCMRKPMHDHGSTSAEFHTIPASCNHDCCHALTVSQSPHLLPSVGGQIATFSAALPAGSTAVNRCCVIRSSSFGRAPPPFSIA